MTKVDWAAMILLTLFSMAMGLFITLRQKAKGEEGFFTANRNLPWWAVGISKFGDLSIRPRRFCHADLRFRAGGVTGCGGLPGSSGCRWWRSSGLVCGGGCKSLPRPN